MSADTAASHEIAASPAGAPHVIIYNPDNQKLVEQLETAERDFLLDPVSFLQTLRSLRGDPLSAPDGSLWPNLTRHETAIDYGFDPRTEAAIAGDALYKRLRANNDPSMRARKVALFIDRILNAQFLGKSSLAD